MSEEQPEQSPEQPNVPKHLVTANRKRGRPPHPELSEAEKKVVTTKQGQRALQRWKAQHMRASEWGGAAEIGLFLRQKGKKNISVAIEVYAADQLKKGIERCDSLIETTTDPELKVRLEEARKDYCDKLAKVGQSLGKDEGHDGGQQVNKPVVNVFPANQQVIVSAVAPTPEKVIDS